MPSQLEILVAENINRITSDNFPKSVEEFCVLLFALPLDCAHYYERYLIQQTQSSLKGMSMHSVDYQDDGRTAYHLHLLIQQALKDVFDEKDKKYAIQAWLVELIEQYGFNIEATLPRKILEIYLLQMIPENLENQQRYEQIQRVIVLCMGEASTTLEQISLALQDSSTSIKEKTELFAVALKQMQDEESKLKKEIDDRLGKMQQAIESLPPEASQFSLFGGSKIKTTSGETKKVCGTYAAVHQVITQTRRKSAELPVESQQQKLAEIQQTLVNKDLEKEQQAKLSPDSKRKQYKANVYRRVTLTALTPDQLQELAQLSQQTSPTNREAALVVIPPSVQQRKLRSILKLLKTNQSNASVQVTEPTTQYHTTAKP